MSTQYAACLRCGIRRAVKPERGIPELCADCRLVERDLANMHGTDAGYSRHIKQRTLPCSDCVEAHRLRVESWRRGAGLMPRLLNPCGTNAAYYGHRRRGEVPCDDCREAQAEYQRTYYATVRKPRMESA